VIANGSVLYLRPVIDDENVSLEDFTYLPIKRSHPLICWQL